METCVATEEPKTGDTTTAPKACTGNLIRDAAVLQVKLVVDGLRDLLLVPASIIAAIMSAIDGHNGKPGTQFYDLLEIGKRSESWIDLFGALRDRDIPEQPGGSSIDDVVSRIEAYVVDEYRRGGVTKQAKDRIDQLLEALHRKSP
jgi:hypothetical protein